MMEAVNSSETSFNIYQTTWCYIPEVYFGSSFHRDKL
jgi:hypothetical protein